MNQIAQVNALGQSVWYDNIQRGLIDSGDLQALVAQGISGITSNPTIFEKAIGGSGDYDPAIRQGVEEGLSLPAIYDRLTLDDIARGADLLRPVFDRTQGADGYISIEVPPTMARNADRTVNEARRLFRTLDRPNVMIKVPATEQGIPAVERLIRDSINVNVTLIFSLSAYDQVISAYLNGLQARAKEGQPIDRIASVASFFVSRVDTLVDRLIAERGADPDLAGKAAIANAKLAYRLFRTRFAAPKFARLAELGARVQRPLWASTSTKNPKYSELLYVKGLIGPDTVNTMPPATIQAVLGASDFTRTIDGEVADAENHLNALKAAGIHMDEVTATLLLEGVASFEASFVSLFRGLARKRLDILRAANPDFYRLGSFSAQVDAQARAMTSDQAVERLWRHDPSLWTDDPSHQAIIQNALGWLRVAEWASERTAELTDFADTVRQEGFTDAVVLGMGGSSLVSDVLIACFPHQESGLKLHVLDTTHPAAVDHLTQSLPLQHTLFLVASKSGSTTEPNAFYHYFWNQAEAAGIANPGRHFVAITDPGTSLEREAEARGFLRTFLNPADIGGRYSALSLFGLVPAALQGIDVNELLDRALAMSSLCETPNLDQNPGGRLGAALGVLARQGRDKVSLVFPPAVSRMADWIEQLLAESTGKSGRGLIPVAHEALANPDEYGQDRVFVAYRTREEATMPPPLQALAEIGQPVIELEIADSLDLSAEFFRWEVATAIAGAILHIDAFDQPNVQESKDNTKRLIQHYEQRHALPQPATDWVQGNFEVRANRVDLSAVHRPADLLLALKRAARANDYLAILAYVDPSEESWTVLQDLRGHLRTGTRAATTLGFGPRFLHSTGQLHKGGPDFGVFLQLVNVEGPKLAVPDVGYDFETLILAQALGDFESLVAHQRRVINVHLQGNWVEGIRKLMGR